MTANEAAERLRSTTYALAIARRGYLNAALAAERRATVERIREALLTDEVLTSNRLVSERIALRLDEEAAR